MDPCIMMLRQNKTDDRKNKVVFVNGVHEATRERATYPTTIWENWSKPILSRKIIRTLHAWWIGIKQ